MLKKPLRKFLKPILFRSQKGQGILEYVLVMAVVLSIFLIFAKPFVSKFGPRFRDIGKEGFFADDSSGSQFYYYRIK